MEEQGCLNVSADGAGQWQGENVNVASRTSKSSIATGEMIASEALLDLYDLMLGDVDIPSVLRDVADIVCRATNAQRASIYLVRPETQDLESVAVVGNVARTIRIPICTSSLAGFCATSGQSFVVNDAYDDLGQIDPQLHFDRSWDEANGFRTKDVMCAPAMFKGEVMGVAQVINSNASPFTDANLRSLRAISRMIGYALYHAKLYSDLSDFKKLDQEKAAFMRTMIHELKSPVAAAHMMAQAMQMQNEDDPMILRMTTKITDRMDSLTDLIKDILELASVKSGVPLGDVTEIDVAAEIESTCQTYHDQARMKGLTMVVSLCEGPVRVRFDTQGFRMVVSNLLSNAVKYTQAGDVRAELRQEGAQAVLSVSDSGIGIPQADIPKLFKEFFRASNAKRDGIPGSGVGLAGAKQLIERFGGTMELQSVENEGSTFIVRLPLVQ